MILLYNKMNDNMDLIKIINKVYAYTDDEEPWNDDPSITLTGGRWLYGTYVWTDGCQYKGEHKNNKAHGKGTYIISDNQNKKLYYKGDFYEGDFHGYGFIQFENKDHYLGMWKEDHRSGKGTHIYKNGDRFHGFWKEDLKEGWGNYIFKKKKKNIIGYTSFWSKDELVCYGELLY